MKKLSLILAMILCPAFLWAQVSNPSIISVSSAPSGSCSAGLPNQQVVSTGTQYSCQNGTWGAIGGGSGGSPAGASGNPQINAAGSFGADTNVFAAQAGDTISSIETECSAACTYTVNIPQTFTLTASHTLSSNVHVVFGGHGSWTVNGSGFTLTIPTQVNSEALTQHFVTGTGRVKLGPNNSLVPVEWFGAVADGNIAAGTGTDNTTPIQNALNALSAGQVLLQCAVYKTTAPLTISASSVGMQGGCTGQNVSAITTLSPGPISTIFTTSASADVIDVHGTSSLYLQWNVLQNFAVARSVLPSGTAAGFSLEYINGGTFNQLVSSDSMKDFYIIAVASSGTGIISNSRALWGFGSLTEVSGTYCGFCIDSSGGIGTPSIKFSYDGAATYGLSGITSYGLDDEGTFVNDTDIDHFETATVTQGLRFVATGTGGNNASDIHITNSTNDGFYGSAFYFSGLAATSGGDVEVGGGHIDSGNLTGNTAAIDIESSSGIKVHDMSIGMTTGGNLHDGIDAINSSNLILTGNTFQKAAQTYIYLDNTNGSVVASNKIGAIAGAYGLWIDGTSANNTLAANNVTGTLTSWGIFTGTSTSDSTMVGNSAQGTFTLGAIGANGPGNVLFNPNSAGFPASLDTSSNGDTTDAAYLAMGANNVEGWNKTAVTRAWNLGFAVPGSSAGNNPIFDYYNGTAWAEAWDINSANGVLDAVNGINTPNIKSGTASNTDLAGQLTLASGTATYTFTNTYTSAPICVATDTTAASAVKASATTTVLTLTGTGTDVLNYICMGRN